jgi:hypothetical protein
MAFIASPHFFTPTGLAKASPNLLLQGHHLGSCHATLFIHTAARAFSMHPFGKIV